MELSEELTAQNPCSGATIVFPPFGIITPEYPSPSTPVGGGGATMPGVIHNPSIPIAGGSGFFNPVGGSNPSSGTIGTPVAGSSSGQGGIVNVLAAVGDAVQSAWNWIVNLFTPNPKPGSSDCGCKRRAVVLEPSPNPCPGDEGGYIAIVVQDEISDKIVKFQEYFMVLHNNDNVFLYENPQIVNDIEAAIAQNPANYNLFAALPELISATRLEKIDWGFVKKIISALNINPQSLYTPESYPGKEDGRPFEWWMDDIYIKTNLKMQTTDTAAPTETPNIYEILVFRLYPAQALKHVYNSVIAASMAANSGFQGKRNGKQDAFRHTFWNARDTADFGKVITEIFTTAHEINSGNHSLETEMDLFNNSQGRDIGESHSYITPNAVLATQITYDINTGTLKYLTPLTPEPSSDVIPGQTQIKWTNQ